MPIEGMLMMRNRHMSVVSFYGIERFIEEPRKLYDYVEAICIPSIG